MKYEEIGCYRHDTEASDKEILEGRTDWSWFSYGHVKLHPSENFYIINDVHDIFFFFLSFCAVRSVSCAISVSDGKRTINKWLSIKSIWRVWITCQITTFFCLNYVPEHDFSVTSVPRVANTMVRANSVSALRLHMTDGRRVGAFINICYQKIRAENKLVFLKSPARNTTLFLDFFFLVDNVQFFFFLLFFTFCAVRCESSVIFWAGQKISEFQLNQKMGLYFLFSNHIIVPDLRTCARYSVTSVPRVASTAVWAHRIGALRVHVTGGRRRGAFVDILSKNKYCFF